MKKWLPVLLLLVSSVLAAQTELDKIALRHAYLSFSELHELLSIPNDAHFPEDIEKNIIWADQAFAKGGLRLKG